MDREGNIYVTGTTDSSDFPLTGCAVPNKPSWDIFVTVLNPTASDLVFSTYLGGNSLDHGHAIAVDASGGINVTGGTYSSDFPIQGAFQPTIGGSRDAFVTKLTPWVCPPRSKSLTIDRELKAVQLRAARLRPEL